MEILLNTDFNNHFCALSEDDLSNINGGETNPYAWFAGIAAFLIGGTTLLASFGAGWAVPVGSTLTIVDGIAATVYAIYTGVK